MFRIRSSMVISSSPTNGGSRFAPDSTSLPPAAAAKQAREMQMCVPHKSHSKSTPHKGAPQAMHQQRRNVEQYGLAIGAARCQPTSTHASKSCANEPAGSKGRKTSLTTDDGSPRRDISEPKSCSNRNSHFVHSEQIDDRKRDTAKLLRWPEKEKSRKAGLARNRSHSNSTIAAADLVNETSH